MVSDKDELDEMETVAKVFVVEKRMIDITYNVEPENIIEQPFSGSSKKIKIHPTNNRNRLPFLTVRGLN